ncbi:MAG: FHA domain-containing protein [Microcoleus sp. PH2017_15_JOR_U_A]|uniref:FHA domain-containing protein n=1 Tax=unclassified Microcoleus TaxID=2642155 RepID=UPI001D26B3EB|nr:MULTISPECIES: FHA domain-containing protein [unclassified Microcoleus]MCC3471200.1 FHA domain-containing protein [Microcoleus sp. PH2017_13_LAR_U_A]MCC3483854.1 FHA domain-containing protein [Microcoleus sp. PH2017_14_LAR_D_A]MCC3495938.1 FHA domain-containing protein [Microcoleus sp. PH2017_15_JOR_U_A]MCC3595463.1 FHA domain-containing protein [Microcoleus sp. PH2017_26_ELK_O_A]MCC3620519.1 FHA domain-containing protein [Microcoleus sp. PH2017_36_ELK_O_B]
MQLKLKLEQTGQSWTLKPNGREYVIGSGSDCDIPLPNVNVVDTHHLKLSFNQSTNTWHVCDLGSKNGTFVDSQPITDYSIKAETRIVIAGGVLLVATPVDNSVNVTQQQTSQPTVNQSKPVSAKTIPSPSLYSPSIPISPPATVPPQSPQRISQEPDRKLIRAYFECLRKRNNAAAVQESIIKKVVDDFIASIKEKRLPLDGIFVYVFIMLIIITLFINIWYTFLLIILAVILSTVTTPRPPKLPIPPVSDQQIQKWLQYDVQQLIDIGQQELRIVKGNGEDIENIIDGEPIVLFSGVNEKLSKSNFINWKELIDTVGISDYFCEPGIDKNNKYSIYDFIAIFPCKNFIAYYRCKWNFIRGTSLTDETCEYLYDSIVSVKTIEFSSSDVSALLNISKEIYGEAIMITTTDSKEIRFPVIIDLRVIWESSSRSYNSTARDAAHNIRQQVRQRKPGFIRTESVSERRQSLFD